MTRALQPLTGKAEVKRQKEINRLQLEWEEESGVQGCKVRGEE